MCGICGFTWRDDDTLLRMMARLRHRGPDQSGYHVAPEISLGHQRLSIIDLTENGREPIANERGDVWLIFNGEIYNFRELRRTLEERGHVFVSRSDSEVVLHAYEEYGLECLQKFNGMFAFAIWDDSRRRLFLARDRLGEKPLYYSTTNCGLIFASEIKAILENPQVHREVNEEALRLLLGFEFVPAPWTLFKGIHRLPAAHFLLFENGNLSLHRYWKLPCEPSVLKRGECEVELLERLERAVRLRMYSDVPMGAFLSGGIDSSSVVAMMNRHSSDPVRTFCLGYQESSYSEFEHARRVAAHFGTDHSELLIDPITPETVEEAIWHLDEPASEFSMIPYYLICRKAREQVTVCLGGDGGDELFAGYDRFKASKAAVLIDWLPSSIGNGIGRLVARINDRPEKKGAINSFKRFVEGSCLPKTGGHLRWQYFLNQRHESGLFRSGFLDKAIVDAMKLVSEAVEGCSSNSRIDREIYAELTFFMPENPLLKLDRMSMAHALEIRSPFLDHEFVEFVSGIPSAWKLEGWTSKAVLKSAVSQLLPPGIASRPKHGYSFPIKHWLRSDWKEYVSAELSHCSFIREFVNAQYLSLLWQRHSAGFENHSHVLWSLLSLAVWYRIFFESGLVDSRFKQSCEASPLPTAVSGGRAQGYGESIK